MKKSIKSIFIVAALLAVVGSKAIICGNQPSKQVKEGVSIEKNKKPIEEKKRKREDSSKEQEEKNKKIKKETKPEDAKPENKVEEKNLEVKTVGVQKLENTFEQKQEQNEEKRGELLKECVKTFVLNLMKDINANEKTTQQIQEEHKEMVEQLSKFTEKFNSLVKENKDIRNMVEELRKSKDASEIAEKTMNLDRALCKKWWWPAPIDVPQLLTSVGSCCALGYYVSKPFILDYFGLYCVALGGTRFVEWVASGLYSMIFSSKKK